MIATDRMLAVSLYGYLKKHNDVDAGIHAFAKFASHYHIENRIPNIIVELQRVEKQSRNATVVTVTDGAHTSTFSDEFIEQILSQKSEMTTYVVDHTIVGGCQIREGNTLWDYSARTILDQLRNTLVNSPV